MTTAFSLSFWGEKNQLATIDVAELKTVVEQIKPAHLRFVISGITWADLESVNMTWKYFLRITRQRGRSWNPCSASMQKE